MASPKDHSSKDTSPRVSFSLDLAPESINPCSPQNNQSSPNSDFDFNVSLEVLTAPADEIFSNGRILPLPLKSPNLITRTINEIAAVSSSSNKNSLWKFGRSSSLNCGGSGSRRRIKVIPRSKSAGSDPDTKPKPQSQPKRKTEHGRAKKSYYGSGGRMSPMLNVPTPYFPKERGLIGFLMCTCGGGGDKNVDY